MRLTACKQETLGHRKLQWGKSCTIHESNQTSVVRKAYIQGRVAQSVTCLATDACLTADHEIIATVILFPSADSFKKGCCQLQAKVCAQIIG